MLNDIIREYQLAFNTVRASANPKTQLKTIINFFKICEHHNFLHVYKYFIKDFIHCVYSIFKHSSVDFLDPYYLYASKYMLRKSLDFEKDRITVNEINTAIEMINFRLLILLYHLGEIENGKMILLDLIKSNNVFTYHRDDSIPVNKLSDTKSLVDPALFHVNKAFDILKRIDYEISLVNSYSENSVNILLVESDNTNLSVKNNGIVQELNCRIEGVPQNRQNNFFIENMIDIHEEGFEELKNPLINSANILLKYCNESFDMNKCSVSLRFTDAKGIYKGKSFGAGASLLLCAAYLSHIDRRIKVSIASNTAFTGSITDTGNLPALPEISIETKIEAAFFSWVNNVVLPKDNLETAKKVLHELQKKYRRKELNLFGLNNIAEIFDNKNIVHIKEESRTRHTIRTIQKHKNISYTALIILLVTLTAFSVYKIVPRNFKPLPQTKGNLNIIYTPDRDTAWIFKSTDIPAGDTINFGEVAIGDLITHKFGLYNNADEKHPLRAELQGTDKEEFEVQWCADQEQNEAPYFVKPDIKQRLIIKFVPFKSKGDKYAELVFYNDNAKKDKRIIYLKGKTDLYKGGYSIKLKDNDEYIISPNRGNILNNNFTISFWFKVNNPNTHLFVSQTPQFTSTKIGLGLTDTLLRYHADGNLSKRMNGKISLTIKKTAKLNEWNYAALSHKNNLTYLILNDEIDSIRTKEYYITQLEDYFHLTENHPLERETKSYKKDGSEYEIAELKIYNESLSPFEILNTRFEKTDYRDKRLLIYHDFEEMVGHFIMDKTHNDIHAELFGLPARSMDIPPLNYKSLKNEGDSSKNNYVQIKNKGEIRLSKDLFGRKSSFTIQFECKMDGNIFQKDRSLMSVSNISSSLYWHFDSTRNKIILFINSSNLRNSYNQLTEPVDFIRDNIWHKYTLTYSLNDKKSRLYIDGKLYLELHMPEYEYDISREYYCIYFGKDAQYDNPRYFTEDTSIDNICIFNRALNTDEVTLSNPYDIKNLQGLLAFWTLDKIKNNICYDEINRIPVFLWDDFEAFERK